MHWFGRAAATVGIAFFGFFGHHHNVFYHPVPTPTPTPTPVVSFDRHHHGDHDETVTAQGSYSQFGQTINFTLTFPEDGGSVSGQISGACTGTISGTYAGDHDKDLHGTAQASCPVFLTTISGTAVFYADIDHDDTSSTLHAKVTADGQTEDISVPLTLSH